MSNWNIESFIEANKLAVGDAVQLERTGLGLTSQYLLFQGHDQHQRPVFAAKVQRGAIGLTVSQTITVFQNLTPTRIHRFKGTEKERAAILKKVNPQVNEDTFDLLLNWCLNGRPKKEEGDSGLSVAAGIALAALGLGLLFWGLSDDEDD
jgi:hypothetical protein